VNRHVRDDFHIDLGDLAPPETAQEFVPPYPLYDVSIEDLTNFDVHDQSFASPSIGHVINNVTHEYDDHTSFINGIFEIYVPLGVWVEPAAASTTRFPAKGVCALARPFRIFIPA
jgi:hypothetical protein